MTRASLDKRPSDVAAMFDDVAAKYDLTNDVLSLGQDRRRRRLVREAVGARRGETVLDIAAGTGTSSAPFADAGVNVVPADFSLGMLRVGNRRRPDLAFTAADALRLPFADESFDAVTFTYLLRYVDDPAATVAELARVLRPGGVMAELEFHVPQDPWARAGWKAYTRTLMPAAGTVVSSAWYRTGRFLGPNIEAFYRQYPLPVQVRMWQEAGMRRVRTKVMTMGVAIVTWGVKRSPLTDD
jgi:demethylmenaquinone methyltransferase/2-methoxy-6-polyprenyl-1,4-benzoquinol methylase